MRLEDGEQVIGFGEQFVSLDQRGRSLRTWSDDLLASTPRSTYWPAPIFFTSRGRGCIVDTRLPCDVTVDEGAVSVEVAAGDVEVVQLGGDLRSMVAQVGEVLGRPPRVPDWTFGVWINAGGGQDRVLDTARRIRSEGIPCSAVWVWDYYDEALNSGCRVAMSEPFGEYPDLAAMNRALHGMGLRSLGYLNPYLPRDTLWHRRALAEGFAVRGCDGEPAHVAYFHPWQQRQGALHIAEGAAALLDFTHPAGRRAWCDNVLRMVDERGWDGWMQDFGEQLDTDMRLADGSSGAQSHNAYVAAYHALTAEALRGRDAVWFARAGSNGDQARVPVLWPGDQRCDWSDERGIGSILAAGLSAGLMGVAAWGPDIPGFTDGLGGGTADRELWLRWVQLGALTPVMRTHIGFKSPDPRPVSIWTDERTVAAFRYWAGLHVQLQPYICALAEEASRTGIPIMRCMALEFPEAPSWIEATQYMLGPSLLVAPVLHPGARSRSVWFPRGAWWDLWSDRCIEGGGVVEVEAPLEHPAVFQRLRDFPAARPLATPPGV